MNVFCLSRFIKSINELKDKKQYRDIEKNVIEYFFDKEDKDISEVLSGTRLNGSDNNPYIKKRFNGSGGYRLYYYLVVKDNNAYLMFIHPKTGPNGSDNTTEVARKLFYKEVLDAIQSDDLYKVSLDKEKMCLLYDKVIKVKQVKK